LKGRSSHDCLEAKNWSLGGLDGGRG
jgi:hypothetical protein